MPTADDVARDGPEHLTGAPGWIISTNCADYPTCSVIDLVPLPNASQ